MKMNKKKLEKKLEEAKNMVGKIYLFPSYKNARTMNEMEFEVLVMAYKLAYGRVLYMVVPVKGRAKGEVWVETLTNY